MPAAEVEPPSASRFSDGPAANPGFLLWHVTHAWQRAVAAVLAPLDLTHVQFVLLACVWWLEEQGCTPNQLQLARQAGTDVEDDLAGGTQARGKGLIEHAVDPADTRARRLQATPAGARLARRGIVAVEDVDARFFARETDAARDVLQRLVVAHARPEGFA